MFGDPRIGVPQFNCHQYTVALLVHVLGDALALLLLLLCRCCWSGNCHSTMHVPTPSSQ